MKWEDEYRMYCQQGDEDDEGRDDSAPGTERYRLSISSESDVAGVEISSPNQPIDDLFSNGRERQDEIWAYSEIEATLKELPNADSIGEMLNSLMAVKDVPVDYSYDLASTLLLVVWASKHDWIAQILAKAGVNVNACDQAGRTALHLACYIGDYRAAELLLQHGAKAQIWDKERKATPLHCGSR